MGKLRVLLVDDNANFLKAAGDFLQEFCNADVVGRVSDVETFHRLAQQLRPDVVVIDVVMGGASGTAAAGRILALPEPPVVVLTSLYEPADYWKDDGALPADAFISKHDFTTRIAGLLNSIASGQFRRASRPSFGGPGND